MKDQKVDFSFNYVLEDEDGKQSKNTLRESFRYAVDALNLMTVTAGGEKGFVETGKEDEMLLEFDLGQMREMLEEAVEEEIDKMENADASAAEAKRASASDLLIKWDDESSDGAGSKKDPAVIKNLKCEVETFGLKLEKFKAVPVKDDDNFGTSLKCNFYVSRKTLPGTYYGRVNASYKIKGKSFHTVQGFQVVVKQETGELELVGKIGDSEIVMTGPVSSFPKADELSLKVSEVTQEQQEKVDEALQKKAEEEGNEIKQYKALDIKLMADGVETEPEGDVQVRFKNVELENADEKKKAEQEKAEEQSIVKKAVRKVMSLFGAKDDEEDVAAVAEVDEAEGTTAEESEKAAGTDGDKKEDEEKEESGESGEAAENSENIKVLHLDEDAVVANEMKSEVQENGDIIMDTDHFSVYLIYITVNIPNEIPEAQIIVRHYAYLDKWEIQDNNGNLVESKKEYFYTGYKVNDAGEKVKIDASGPAEGTKVPANMTLDYMKVSGAWEKADSNKNLVERRENYYYTGYKIDNNQKVRGGQTEGIPVDATQIKKLSLVEIPAGIMTGHDGNSDAERKKKYGNSKLYPGSITPDLKEKYEKIKTEIYSEDVVELPNGSGTGINREILVKNLAKAGNYEVDYVKVINSEYGDNGKDFSNSSEDNIIELKEEKNIIEIYYIPKNGTIEDPAEFHDYNVSVAAINNPSNEEDYLKSDNASNSAVHFGLRTRRVGINNINLINGTQTGTTGCGDLNNNYGRIGIGIWNSDGECDSAIWHHYLNQHGGSKPFNTYTIPNVALADEKYQETGKKKIVFNNSNVKKDPGLFIPKDIPITERYYDKDKEEYRDAKGYFAKKYFSDFSLTFDRKGDSYVLSTVKQNNESVLENLNEIRFSTTNWQNLPLYSNLFWPLDKVNYGEMGVTRDPLFGSKTSKDKGVYDQYGFPHNDEIKYKTDDDIKKNPTNYGHNWYFGMRYDFSFKVGDYTGPMNYYFRGDDDFWLYIDGKLVEDVELGGVHIANGSFADIRNWLERHGGIDKDKDYEVSIFFMERGGTGSCCYMAFTLPNVTSHDGYPEEDLTTYTVEKKWQDGITANGIDTIASKPLGSVRPTKIMVQLYQDGLKFGEKVELNKENNWTYKWDSLPKCSEVGTNVLHQYSVGEVSYGDEKEPYDENYVKEPHYEETKAEGDSPGSTIITNIRQIDIPVNKEWIGDNEGNRPKKIKVNLWKKLVDIPENSAVSESAILQSLMEEDTESSDYSAEGESVEGADSPNEDGSDEYEDVESEDIPNEDSSKDPNQETTTNNDNNTFVVLDKTDPNWETTWSKATRGQGNNKEKVPQIVLSSENQWIDNTTWVNMPLFELDETDKKWKKVIYAVEEVDEGQLTPSEEEGWYEATYDWNNVDGFTITNSFIIPVNIPISKQCIAFNDMKDFKFKIEEVNGEKDWSLKLNPAFSMTTSINVSKGEGEGKFVINYKMKGVIDEISNSPNHTIERWYKISEDEKDGESNFINDKTFYIVKVELKKNSDGSYSAQRDPTQVYKNGTLLEDKEINLKFINYKKVDLEISKKVDKGSTTKSFAFTAEIALPENGDITSFKLPPSTPGKGEYVPNSDGSFSTGYSDAKIITNDGSKFIEVSFELKDSSKVIIPVPIGASIKIKETEHAGYYVSYEGSKNLTLTSDGEDAVKFTVEDSGKISVNCINTQGAVLPDTGGPGLLMMNRLGWMLLLLALLMAGMEIQFYGERRNRKTATIQREDSKGFDPDDY